MSLDWLLSETCLRVRYATVTDDYNNEVRDPNNPTVATYPCRLEQTPSMEITVGANTQISNWVIYLPPDADVKGTDVIQADGVTYEVLGPPMANRSPIMVHHQEARLIFVE
jgi:hypothetical protein